MSVSNPTTSEKPSLYVAIGASDATGVGANPITRGYAFLLAEHLKTYDAKFRFLNLGINGATVKILNQEEVIPAIAGDPTIITLFVGPNDIVRGSSHHNFEVELNKLLASLSKETRAKIYISTVPDLTRLPAFASHNVAALNSLIRLFNETVRSCALQYNANLVELSEEQVQKDFVSADDGFHPSTAGHAKIAECFWNVIKAQL